MFIGTVCGNVGQDSETKVVGDTTVTSFSVASNRKVKGKDETTWVRCSYWGKAGEAVAPYLKKGTSVGVAGELEVRTYEKNGGGGTGVSIDMRVDRLQLLGGGKGREEGVSNGTVQPDPPF